MSKMLKRAHSAFGAITRKAGIGFLLALGLVTAVYADSIITGSKPFTFIPGTVISSSQVNADFDYIINQVNTNAAKNGANSSITSLLGLTTPIAPGFGGSSVYYATSVGGTGDAITVSATTPAISSFTLTAGNSVVFIPTATNTISGPTLNVNGTGAVILKRVGAQGVFNLRPGEIPTAGAGNIGVLWATYDGFQWVVLNPIGLFGTSLSIASATTTDLGLAGSRHVNITGTTTITSFGTTANVSLPIYYVTCGGTFSLTGSASLILPTGASSGSWTCTNGDQFLARFFGSGWRMEFYDRSARVPTVQRFTSGTAATYTPTASTRYIKVRMVGGGGGGAGQTANNGGNGTTSSFGTWTAIFGNGGVVFLAGGVGGTGGVDGTGTLIARFSGQDGQYGINGAGYGGGGGNSVFGGAAPWRAAAVAAGIAGKANTGSGGGGGQGAAAANGGGGGGAGEYVEFYMTAAQIGASQTYTVGALGAGGAAGTTAGGNGAAGIIIVEEFSN